MRIYDVIEKKAQGGELTEAELQYFIDRLCSGELPDYQAAALIMAIFIRGMTDEEISVFTRIMAHSGERIDLSAIGGVKVDKHSTGGIGDKTTLIIGPIVAACGGKVAKMSGRGLGYSGGTIDKLEAIPGFRTALSEEEFVKNVNDIGMAVTGQTANVAPADKKIYALRDVTATVSSIPLIASSIMSKKLSSGADKLVLDVKTGSGALLQSREDAERLAQTMVRIGNSNGMETVALLTNMNRPLGRNVGNLLEVQEAAETLRGEGPEDLTEVCLCLAGQMLKLSGKGDYDTCRERARNSLHDGSAMEVFRRFVAAQGGDIGVLEHPEKYYRTPLSRVVKADRDGYLHVCSAAEIGKSSVTLGAGRMKKEDAIDFTAGIVFRKCTGEAVSAGDALYTMYAADERKLDEAEQTMREAVAVKAERPTDEPLILAQFA